MESRRRKNNGKVYLINQGTTSARAILFDHDGNPRWHSQQDIKQYFLEPGGVEHDAKDTFSRSTKLFHGGLGYLKKLEVALVANVAGERAIVHQNAPHIVQPR